MKRSSMGSWLMFVPALILVATVNADTLTLRDGRRVEGRLVSVGNGVVEFNEAGPFNSSRILRFNRDEVLGVEFDAGNRDSSPYSSPPAQQRGRPSGLRERQVMVAANVQWVDTNVDVRSGQDVYFEPSGEVHWGPNRTDGPAGEQNSPMNPNRPIPNRPGAALIGRVGGNSSDYFYIGADRSPFKMRSSGRLFLGINDDNLRDNSGYFRVVVYY